MLTLSGKPELCTSDCTQLFLALQYYEYCTITSIDNKERSLLKN